MLPFLKKLQEGSIAMPVESVKREPDSEEGTEFDSLEVAAQDVMEAIHSKDVKALTSALKAAFDICESQPHMEASHNG